MPTDDAPTVMLPRSVVLEILRIADSWADPGERSGLTKRKRLYDPDACDLLTGLVSLTPDLAAALRSAW